ncbi:MAG TPA: hypothetical protein VEU31_00610 [Candidatus Acidoferrales bacterium]|nr:hypothetical protein [Candidatus Acidoferrales bacterium]
MGGRGAVIRSGASAGGVPRVFVPPSGRAAGAGAMGVPFVPVRNRFIARRPIFVPRIFSPFGIRHRFLFRRRFFVEPFFVGGFGFPFCPQFGFWAQEFFFANQLNCWGDPFFFSPGFNTFGFPYGPEVVPPGYYAAQPYVDATGNGTGAGEEASTKEATNPTVTWLQTKQGEIFGLADYWVDDGRLFYVTNYGANNSIPLDQIDLDKTVELNAKQGVEFVLRRKPAPRE